jgi:hypothetical protein
MIYDGWFPGIPQKELVLIEIERAGTRLLKSDGGQHSDLTVSSACRDRVGTI